MSYAKYQGLWNMVRRLPEAEAGAGDGGTPPAPVASAEGGAAEAAGEAEAEGAEADSGGNGGAAPSPTVALSVFQRRIAQIQGRTQSLEQELAAERQRRQAVEKELGEYQLTPPAAEPATPAAPDPRTHMTVAQAEAYAARLAATERTNERANRIAQAGIKEFGQPFVEGVNLLVQATGGIPNDFIEAVLETDEDAAPKVFMALTKDLEKAQELLGMSGTRQAVAITKFVDSVKKAGDPAGKPVSKAPAPITPKLGGGKTVSEPSLDDTSIPIDDWMKARNEQIQVRGRRRR